MKEFIKFIKKHPIYSGVICFVGLCIFVLFVAACSIHCYVNSYIQKNIDSLSVNFENTKTNIDIITKNISHECTQDKVAENVSQELESLCSNIKDTISEITQLHSKTFDANTVTFLITFLSALLFTVFITLFIKNIEQFDKIHKIRTKLDKIRTEADTKIEKANNSIAKADTKITEANDRIAEADTKIAEVDAKIAEAEKDWNTKLQYQEYLLKVATERNSLTQVLNLVSVLGSLLASSGYIIKEGYPILAYMIFRKTQLVLKEGFKDIKDIRPEDKTEFMQIITDCITYLSIETLENKNPQKGLPMFTLLYKDLKGIRKKIENIQSHT